MNDGFQSRINPSKNVSSFVQMFVWKGSLSAKIVNTKYERLFFLVFVSKEERRERESVCIEINYINYDIEKEHHSSLSIEEKRSRVILSLSPYWLVKAP